MIGRRVKPDGFDRHTGETVVTYLPGDYGYSEVLKKWMACTPAGTIFGMKKLKIKEHDDGTISVKQVIRVKDWVGTLTKGVWQRLLQ